MKNARFGYTTSPISCLTTRIHHWIQWEAQSRIRLTHLKLWRWEICHDMLCCSKRKRLRQMNSRLPKRHKILKKVSNPRRDVTRFAKWLRNLSFMREMKISTTSQRRLRRVVVKSKASWSRSVIPNWLSLREKTSSSWKDLFWLITTWERFAIRK